MAECSNHHPSLSSLRPKWLSCICIHIRMHILYYIYMYTYNKKYIKTDTYMYLLTLYVHNTRKIFSKKFFQEIRFSSDSPIPISHIWTELKILYLYGKILYKENLHSGVSYAVQCTWDKRSKKIMILKL